MTINSLTENLDKVFSDFNELVSLKEQEINNLKNELKETELLLYSATDFLSNLYAARKAGMCVTFGKHEKCIHVKPIAEISMGDLLKTHKKLKRKYGK